MKDNRTLNEVAESFGADPGITEEKQPTKSEVEKLVELFGKKKYSIDRAPIPTQQKLYDRFNDYLEKLRSKYPDVDMDSNAFWRGLETAADRWLDKQAIKGAGRFW